MSRLAHALADALVELRNTDSPTVSFAVEFERRTERLSMLERDEVLSLLPQWARREIDPALVADPEYVPDPQLDDLSWEDAA